MSAQLEAEITSLRKSNNPGLLEVPPSLQMTPGAPRKLSISSTGNKVNRLERDNYLKMSAENPQILKQYRYSKLYQNILRDVQKKNRYVKEDEQDQQKAIVKKSIARVIQLNNGENIFNQRFQSSRSKSRKTRSLTKSSGFGVTSLQHQNQKRRAFFNDHRKVVSLEEDCLLLQYYLKDNETERSELSYLTTIAQSSRHRRITPTVKENSRLFACHDERENKSLKRRIYNKEKFVQKCSQIAKKNITFRRRNNFKEIQYILSQHNHNLWQEIDCRPNSEEQQQRLKKNNKIFKLYLNYNFLPDQPKMNEDVTQQSYKNFKADLFSLDGRFKMKELQIDRKIQQIFKFKHHQALHFQDFKQFLTFLEQFYGKDILQMFQERYPDYFLTKKDKILAEHWPEINTYMEAQKIKFLLEIIFRTYPDKLIGGKILPTKMIPMIFKAYGISEKDFKMNDLMRNYHWVQHHQTGITLQQFYKGSILWKMKKDDWKGIEVFLRKVNIRQYV